MVVAESISMTSKLFVVVLVGLVAIPGLVGLGNASESMLVEHTSSATNVPSTPAMASSAQAGIVSNAWRSVRSVLSAPIESYKSYRALPRMVPRGRTLAERIKNFPKWAGSFGPINGLRTRWRHARYTTEPLAAVPEGIHYLELSARQPLLVPAGALPIPNIRHAHVGLRAPGDTLGDWSHLLMRGIKGKNAQGKTVWFPSRKLELDPGFYPDARYDIIRISSENEELFNQAAAHVMTELAEDAKPYIPGKRTCVTYACNTARPYFAEPEAKLPLRARWNGGWMQRYFDKLSLEKNKAFLAEGVKIERVEQALVARDKTRGKLGPAIDWLLGPPGRAEEGFLYRRFGFKDIWEQDRVIRMEPKFPKPETSQATTQIADAVTDAVELTPETSRGLRYTMPEQAVDVPATDAPRVESTTSRGITYSFPGETP